MLLIPFDRKIDWSNAPVITIALLIINSLVFFIFQASENRNLDKAISAYFESDLHQYEFPAYVRLLEKDGKSTEGYLNETGQPVKAPEKIFELQLDRSFMDALHAGRIVSPDDPGYAKWSAARARFEELMSEVVWYEYGLKPGAIEVSDLIAHMFLHGSLMHLLGNMFFLFAVGFMVEAAIGHRLYLLSYLLSGLGSTALDIVLNHYSLTPSIGASGAISGIMGLYAILFGMRKVNFFYFIFVYFDYVKAPALLLFGFWLGNEIFQQLMWSEYSNVNYLAHIGGLLTGAVLGFIYKRQTNAVDEDYLDSKERELQRDTELDKAECFIKALEHDKAVPILQKLLAETPQDHMLLAKLCHAAKFQGASEIYHETALKILGLADKSAAADHLVINTFRDYVQKAKPKPRLNNHLISSLADRFLRSGELVEAERLIGIMAKNTTAFPAAPGYLLRLGQLLVKRQETTRGHQYLKLLAVNFPESNEALIARRAFET